MKKGTVMLVQWIFSIISTSLLVIGCLYGPKYFEDKAVEELTKRYVEELNGLADAKRTAERRAETWEHKAKNCEIEADTLRLKKKLAVENAKRLTIALRMSNEALDSMITKHNENIRKNDSIAGEKKLLESQVTDISLTLLEVERENENLKDKNRTQKVRIEYVERIVQKAERQFYYKFFFYSILLTLAISAYAIRKGKLSFEALLRTCHQQENLHVPSDKIKEKGVVEFYNEL